MHSPSQSLLDTSYLTILEKVTLGEDRTYKDEVHDYKPTIFFRPGDRTTSSHPNYIDQKSNDGHISIGFISEYGSHAERRPPVILEPLIPVRIVRTVAKKIRDTEPSECADAYKELTDPAQILLWLQHKYSHNTLTLDSIITVYTVEYL